MQQRRIYEFRIYSKADSTFKPITKAVKAFTHAQAWDKITKIYSPQNFKIFNL